MKIDAQAQKLLDLIGEIYEASLNSMHWNVVMQMVSELTSSISTGLFVKDNRSGRTAIVHHHGFPEMTLKIYNGFGYRFDPSWEKVTRADQYKTTVLVNPDELKSKSDNIFYSLILEKNIGIKYSAGVLLHSDHNTNVAVAMQRSREQGMFPKESFLILDLLAPHIERSLRITEIHGQLLSDQRAITTGLDGLSTGVIVLGENNRVVYKNAVASEMIERSDGLISISGETIELPSKKDHRRLNEAIRNAHSTHDYSESIGVKSDGDELEHSASLILTVMSPAVMDCDEVSLFQTPIAAVIYLADLGSIDVQVMSRMMQLYKLTNAEAKISVALANGVSVGDIAAINGVKKDTIRTQLKSIFRKTGTSSQSTLVRLVVGLATIKN